MEICFLFEIRRSGKGELCKEMGERRHLGGKE
jgi:hypothetical protein